MKRVALIIAGGVIGLMMSFPTFAEEGGYRGGKSSPVPQASGDVIVTQGATSVFKSKTQIPSGPGLAAHSCIGSVSVVIAFTRTHEWCATLIRAQALREGGHPAAATAMLCTDEKNAAVMGKACHPTAVKGTKSKPVAAYTAPEYKGKDDYSQLARMRGVRGVEEQEVSKESPARIAGR